jgi:hypothetical protein
MLRSATESAYRRRELVRVNGAEVGIRFLAAKKNPRNNKQAKAAARA